MDEYVLVISDDATGRRRRIHGKPVEPIGHCDPLRVRTIGIPIEKVVKVSEADSLVANFEAEPKFECCGVDGIEIEGAIVNIESIITRRSSRKRCKRAIDNMPCDICRFPIGGFDVISPVGNVGNREG